MPVRGDKRLIGNLKKITEDIKIHAPLRTINGILQVAQNISMKYAPVEYSTLVNSIRRKVEVRGDEVVGVLGYYTSYAAYLNFNPNWSPRPPSMKSGPTWNPEATAHFVEKGFTSPEAQREIKVVIKELNKL